MGVTVTIDNPDPMRPPENKLQAWVALGIMRGRHPGVRYELRFGGGGWNVVRIVDDE
jgi:hypothetical protein